MMAAAGGILSVTGTPEEPVTIWGRQMDNLAGAYAAICALDRAVPRQVDRPRHDVRPRRTSTA